MRKKIKELIQGTETPLAFSTNSRDIKQELYLCEYGQDFLLEGQFIPKGSYLLANEMNIRLLNQYIPLIVSKESITAFVLPYIEAGVGVLTLDDSADLVVTARLTGCTFAAELNTKTPTLLHLNKVKPIMTHRGLERAIDQAAIDAEIGIQMFGKDYFTFKKNEYVLSEECSYAATVMGFRQENGFWEYYSQITICNDVEESYSVVSGKQATLSSNLLSTSGMTLMADSKKKPEENSNSIECVLF